MSNEFQLGLPEIKAILLATAIIGAVAIVRYRWWDAALWRRKSAHDTPRPPDR